MQVITAVKDKEISSTINTILAESGWNNIKMAESFADLQEILDNYPEKIDLLILQADMLNSRNQKYFKHWKEYEEKFLYLILIYGPEADIDRSVILEQFERSDADDFIIMPVKNSELKARFDLAQKRLGSKFAWLENMSGLVDAEAFDNIIKREWQRAYRNSSPLSLIMIEVNFSTRRRENFVDSSWQTRNYCLRKIASTISEAGFRPGDIAGLYKQNTFAILLPDTDLSGAREVGNRILRLITISTQNSEHFKSIDSNMGIAGIVPSIREEAHKLLAAAEEALNRAKSSGESNIETISGSEIESNSRLE